MIKTIIDWCKGIKEKTEEIISQLLVNKDNNPNTKVFLNDPMYADLFIEEKDPEKTVLPMVVIGEAGPGYPVGSIPQQALSTKIMINNTLSYMLSKSPKQINKWAIVDSLVVMPRAGKDINAYYDRTSLRFFYFGDVISRRNVFASNSRSVVAHEFGHSFLDILRPDWWNVQCIEIWSFHEAFGDMVATLTALEYEQLVDLAIKETNGNLLESNIITRIAPEMGIGLYNVTQGTKGELSNCLRDLVQKFQYVAPETLPTFGRDDKLIKEPHSFARVFTGAFWEILVKAAMLNKDLKLGLKEAKDIIAKYLLKAVIDCPNTIKIFDAIAKQMMQIDKSEGGKYQEVLKEVFLNRNIIQQKIMMLNDLNLNAVIKTIKEEHEIQTHGKEKVLRTFSTKNIKISEKLGDVVALDNNPLLFLEVTVPNESAYYFDENEKLTHIIESNEEEIIDAAYACLQFLNTKGLVGKQKKAIFENQNGKLVRKKIICTCGKPNYCDPNAPEYGKPWKPKNNSGFMSCHGECLPLSCDCDGTEIAPQPKLGCYTVVRNGNTVSYRSGSSLSRRTC